jgi:hypothetical protein
VLARVSTFEGSPDQVDELTRYANERVLAALRDLEGFNGALADRLKLPARVWRDYMEGVILTPDHAARRD